MQIERVHDRAGLRAFHQVADGSHGRPSLVESVLDPRRNPLLESHRVARWVARDNGELVGRIAAFHQPPREFGGLGFLRFDTPRVARALMDMATNWLAELGCRGADGPVHPGSPIVGGASPFSDPRRGGIPTTRGFMVKPSCGRGQDSSRGTTTSPGGCLGRRFKP